MYVLVANVRAQGRCAGLSRSVLWSAVLGKETTYEARLAIARRLASSYSKRVPFLSFPYIP
jgi:hypothetical protein